MQEQYNLKKKKIKINLRFKTIFIDTKKCRSHDREGEIITFNREFAKPRTFFSRTHRRSGENCVGRCVISVVGQQERSYNDALLLSVYRILLIVSRCIVRGTCSRKHTTVPTHNTSNIARAR